MEPQSEDGGRLGSVTCRWRRRLAQTLDPDSQSTLFPPSRPALAPSATLGTPATARPASSPEELPLDPELTIDPAEALRDIEAAFEPGAVDLRSDRTQEPGLHHRIRVR